MIRRINHTLLMLKKKQLGATIPAAAEGAKSRYGLAAAMSSIHSKRSTVSADAKSAAEAVLRMTPPRHSSPTSHNNKHQYLSAFTPSLAAQMAKSMVSRENGEGPELLSALSTTPSPPAGGRGGKRHHLQFRNVMTNKPFTKDQLKTLDKVSIARNWTSPYWGTWAQLRRGLNAEVKISELPTTVFGGDERLYPMEALEDIEQEKLLAASPPWFPSGTGIYRGNNKWTHIMSHRIENVLNPHRESRKLYVDGAVVEALRIPLKLVNPPTYRPNQHFLSNNSAANGGGNARKGDNVFFGVDMTSEGLATRGRKTQGAPKSPPAAFANTSKVDPSEEFDEATGIRFDWHQIQQRRGAAKPLDVRMNFPLQLYNADQLRVPSRGYPLRGIALRPFGRRLPQPAHDVLLSFGILRGYASPYWLTAGDIYKCGGALHPERSVVAVTDNGADEDADSLSKSSSLKKKKASQRRFVSAAVKASAMEGTAVPLSACHPAVKTYLEMLPSAASHMVEHDEAVMQQQFEINAFNGGEADTGDEDRNFAQDLGAVGQSSYHGPTMLFTCAGWERVRMTLLLESLAAADASVSQHSGGGRGRGGGGFPHTSHWVNIDEIIPLLPVDVRQAVGLLGSKKKTGSRKSADATGGDDAVRAAVASAAPIVTNLTEAKWLIVDRAYRDALRAANARDEALIAAEEELSAVELLSADGNSAAIINDPPKGAKRTTNAMAAAKSAVRAPRPHLSPIPFVNLKSATATLYWNAECLENPSLCNAHCRPLALRFDGNRFGPVAEKAFQRTALRRKFTSPVWVTRLTARQLGVSILPSEYENATVFSQEMAVATGANAVERYYHLADMAEPEEVLRRFPIALSPHVGHCHWVLRHQWGAVGAPRRSKLLDEAFTTGNFATIKSRGEAVDDGHPVNSSSILSSLPRSKVGQQGVDSSNQHQQPSSLPTRTSKDLQQLLLSKLWIDADEAVLHGWQPRPGAAVVVLRNTSGTGGASSKPSSSSSLPAVELVPIISADQGDCAEVDFCEGADDEDGEGEHGEVDKLPAVAQPPATANKKAKRGRKRPDNADAPSGENSVHLRNRFRRRIPFSQRKWYNALQTTDPVKVTGLATFFYRPKTTH